VFHLMIVTPEKVIFDGQVQSLIVPGEQGYLQILTDHAAIITSLISGKMEIADQDWNRTLYAVSGGFLEVSHNQATVLADTVEKGIDIDIERAKKAYHRALERIESKNDKDQIDRQRAKKALRRAEIRLRLYDETHPPAHI
jgi:F-type H+-transporting ATPase subunit epsilon